MRVLLIGPNLEGNLSLQYLASSLRAAGHSARIGTFNTADDVESVRAAAGEADLVGLSMCFQIRAREFLTLAVALKRDRPSRPVIASGHYASCAAVDLLTHHAELDLIAVHEAERIVEEMAWLYQERGVRQLEVYGNEDYNSISRGNEVFEPR